MSRDEFRKLLAAKEGRARLGIDIDGDQAAAILASDELTDSWYRRAGANASQLVPTAARAHTRPPAVAATPGSPKEPATAVTQALVGVIRKYKRVIRWYKRAPQWQKVAAAATAGAVLLTLIAAIVIPPINESVRVAEAATAAELRAQEEIELKEARAVEAAAQELKEAQASLTSHLDEGRDLVKGEAPTWADPAKFKAMQDAYAALERLRSSNNIDKLKDALNVYLTAEVRVGTEAEAVARAVAAAERALETAAKAVDDQFIAAYQAAGGMVTGSTVADAKASCETRRSLNPSASTFLNATAQEVVKVQHYCPDLMPFVEAAKTAFGDGNYVVGDTTDGNLILTGVYRTQGAVSDCYWERHTGSGEILDNDFITHAPDGVTITAYPGEGISVQGCGVWTKVG